ncbi:MAG: hypothetical protein H6822_33120 [Planctomycetaceae bacterium]|nr:hypothetical protein [Planctomycetaceae bacterium]
MTNLYTSSDAVADGVVVSLEASTVDGIARLERAASPLDSSENESDEISEKSLGRGDAIASSRLLEVPADVGEGSAPNTYNMGASIRQDSLEGGGIDTFEVSVFGTWNESLWPRFVEEWDRARQQAEELSGDGVPCLTRDGTAYLMHPAGQRHGVYCRWVIEFEGWTVAIVNRQAESEHSLSVFLKIGSVALMRDGAWYSWVRVRGFLESLGFRISKAVPGRVDVCADIAGVSVVEFSEAFWAGRVIKRAKNYGVHGKGTPGPKTSTGFTSGKGIQIRVYDKLYETKDDPVKQAVLIEKRWGGVPECATRVEFQLRRDALRDEWDINTVEDLFAKLPIITAWLTEEWFRLVEEFDRENRNHERAEVLGCWKRVQEAFRAWTGRKEGTKPKRVTRPPDFSQLRKQLLGVASTIAAGMGKRFEEGGEMLQWLYEAVEDGADDAFGRYVIKRTAMVCSGKLKGGGESRLRPAA